jgi:hypothetical protein
MSFGFGFGVPSQASATGGATLSLNFAGATSLDPKISFTRASSGTYTNSSGLIALTPVNLLTYSQDFDNAAWTKTGSTVTANTIVAPDGTITGDKVEEGAITSQHLVVQSATVVAASSYNMSVYLKAAERSILRITDVSSSAAVNVNLSLGSITSSSLVTSPQITSVGNGWYRVSGTFTSSGTSAQIAVYPIVGGTSSYLGVVGNGFFIWGAQLETGPTATTYIPTTTTASGAPRFDYDPAAIVQQNLLTYSEQFDNAAWTTANVTVSANTVVSPYGDITGDTLTGSAVTTNKFITQASATTTTGAYSGSIYLKAGTQSTVVVRTNDNTASNGARQVVNLSTGTLGALNTDGTCTGSSASISSVGNGWYRVSVTTTYVSALTHIQLNVWFDNYGPSSSANSFYLWGAQINQTTAVLPYLATTSSALTIQNVQPKGLLIEEQRTNLLTYSEQFDNAIWAKVATTATANASVAPDGTTTMDRLTATNAVTSYLYQGPVSATASTTYTASIYIKKDTASQCRFRIFDGGPTTEIASIIVDFTVTPPILSVSTGTWAAGPTLTNVGNGIYRLSGSVSSGAFTSLAVLFYPDSANGPNSTFAWGAQLEAGAFPTSYIPTTSAQVTRAVDVASITGTNFSSWYNATEGTLYGQAQSVTLLNVPASVANGVVAINNGTANNRVDLRLQGSGTSFISFVTDGGVTQATLINSGTYVPNTSYKMAVAYKVNDFASVTNGGTAATDTLGTAPATVNQLLIGSLDAGSSYLNGHIRSITYWPRRLSNTELQGVTA